MRELHVLYGIAVTSRLTETEPAISDAYVRLARSIHVALIVIADGSDAGKEVRWLADNWQRSADTSDERVAALYGSWAQNIKSIT